MVNVREIFGGGFILILLNFLLFVDVKKKITPRAHVGSEMIITNSARRLVDCLISLVVLSHNQRALVE